MKIEGDNFLTLLKQQKGSLKKTRLANITRPTLAHRLANSAQLRPQMLNKRECRKAQKNYSNMNRRLVGTEKVNPNPKICLKKMSSTKFGFDSNLLQNIIYANMNFQPCVLLTV